jgi:DNA helicase-2/ATP-dependent DNA helicase PcrA
MVSQVEQQLFDCIECKQHFILDAGAGSGKTWTLVETLKYVIKNKGKELQQNNQ